MINLAVSLLAVAAWFELFDGVQTIAMGCIRGLKDAKTTFLVMLVEEQADQLMREQPQHRCKAQHHQRASSMTTRRPDNR